jgi:DnaJ like chaperone protein
MIRAQKGFKRSPAGDADDIKKAYRRLMNKNHPDKIAGSNPEADVIAAAERRTREVRSAYEMLKARRSIR